MTRLPHTVITALALAAALAVATLAPIAHAADTETTPVANAQQDDYQDGKAAVARKDWKAASAAFERAVKANPKSADAHNMYAYTQRWLGNMDVAFKHYAEALRLDPNHRGAHEYVGIAYLKAKQPEKAKEHLARLERICGKGCEEFKDLEKAITAYKP
jgi:tetratricopeptide (TPR) repeat protein